MNNVELQKAFDGMETIGSRKRNIPREVFFRYWPRYKDFTQEQCKRNGQILPPVSCLEHDHLFNNLIEGKPPVKKAPVLPGKTRTKRGRK